MQLKVDKTD